MCGAFRRTVLAYLAHHLAISSKHLAAIVAVGQQTGEFAGDIVYRERVGYKFAHHLTTGYQIDKRYEAYLQHKTLEQRGETRQRGLVAHCLWYIEQCCLERCRSARHHGGTCVRQQGVSIVADKLYTTSVDKLIVIFNGIPGAHASTI